MDTINKVICRKCGGDHFTIKCGKEKKEIPIFQEVKTERKYYNRRTHKVKMSMLPLDITEEELMELTFEWGDVIKLKVLHYDESSVAFIEFKTEDQANYFVKALDKTPFDYRIIEVIRVD